MALTARNHIRIDIKFKSNRIWNMKFIKSILTVMKKMEGFSDKKIIFSINVVFEKQRAVSFIQLEIQDTVNILSLIAIFSNNGLSRFLPLTRQGVSDYITQKGDMEYWMDFHEYGKFKLNYQRISFKDTLNWKRINMSVI